MTEQAVVDASAMVDLLAGTELGVSVAEALRDRVLHAPAHLDVEVLSALGRLNRAGGLTTRRVTQGLTSLAQAPVTRHALPGLLLPAWGRRHDLRLADALYVELARALGAPLITTDARLARTVGSLAQLVAP